MNTTKIKIRPFVPYAKDEEKEGREPYAILIEIELDYTIMRQLTIDSRSQVDVKTPAIAKAAFEEILKEMELELRNSLPDTHRDGNHPHLKSITQNHLHSINKKHVIYG